jgi:hypothetical protein
MAAFTQFLEVARTDAPFTNAPPPLLAEVTTGGIYGLIYTRIVRGEAETLPDLLPDLVYCSLVPFIGQDEALAAAGLAGSSAA